MQAFCAWRLFVVAGLVLFAGLVALAGLVVLAVVIALGTVLFVMAKSDQNLAIALTSTNKS